MLSLPYRPAGHMLYTPGMLFMVIERFKNGDPGPAGERFRQRGRMLPEGVLYHTSWMETSGGRCFQVMEAPAAASLGPWVEHWSDLVDFEIVPIMTSSDFWANR